MTDRENNKRPQPFQARVRYGNEPTTLEEMQSAWKARQARYAVAAEAARQDAIRLILRLPLQNLLLPRSWGF